MDPKEFDIEQSLLLPPHRRATFAAHQPQYRPLPVVVFTNDRGVRVISRWTFTPEERQAIANGEDLYLEQLTFGSALQPILPTIGLRDFCPADKVG